MIGCIIYYFEHYRTCTFQHIPVFMSHLEQNKTLKALWTTRDPEFTFILSDTWNDNKDLLHKYGHLVKGSFSFSFSLGDFKVCLPQLEPGINFAHRFIFFVIYFSCLRNIELLLTHSTICQDILSYLNKLTGLRAACCQQRKFPVANWSYRNFPIATCADTFAVRLWFCNRDAICIPS